MPSRRYFAAPWLIPVSLLLAPAGAYSDEALSAKREACRLEARRQIKPRTGGGVSLYEIALKARESYVRDCMARAPAEPVATGSTSKAQTLPAKPGTAPIKLQQPR
jgi:hypothetical protein